MDGTKIRKKVGVKYFYKEKIEDTELWAWSFFVFGDTIPQQITSNIRIEDILPHCFTFLHPVETQSANRTGHKP